MRPKPKPSLWLVEVEETFRRTVALEVEALTEQEAMDNADAKAVHGTEPLEGTFLERVDWRSVHARPA